LDRIVSIGDDCSAAYQIRRYTGIDTPLIFDWLGSPPKVLTQLIEGDFAGFFERRNLVISDLRDTVTDTGCGAVHPHAFSHDGQNGITEAIIDAEYGSVRRRYDWLIDQWRMLGDNACLGFVRTARGNGESATELLDSLSRRFPASEIFLLLFRRGLAHDVTISGNVMIYDVSHDAGPAPNYWQGDDSNWDDALARFRSAFKTQRSGQVWTPGIVGHSVSERLAAN